MLAHERRARLIEALSAEGRLRVSRAAVALDVSEETVRRDLAALEEQGLVRRVHGGALPAGPLRLIESPLAERLAQDAEAKAAIARRALELVPARGSLVLDSGSSTLRVAELLAEEASARPAAEPPRELLVITNSVPAAAVLAGVPGIALEVLGGSVRGVTHAIAGSEADARLRGIRADLALLGANGLSPEHGASTPDAVEAGTKAAMVGAARQRAVLADATKHGAEHVHRFARLDELDALVTDAAPPAPLAAALREAGVEVLLP